MPALTAPSHERERLEKLLHHLQTKSLANVPADLLLDPLPRTRPNIRLVAYCGNVRQVLIGALLRPREFLKLASIPLLVWGIRVVDELAAWLVRGIAAPGLEAVAQQLLVVVFWFIAGATLMLVALGLRGRISSSREPLFLDLNELSHYTLTRSEQKTPWRDVYTSDAFRLNWVGVKFEHGDYLAFRLRDGNRDVLAQIMRELVRHHHPDLYGQMDRNDQQLN